MKSDNEEERFRQGVRIDAIPPNLQDAIRIAEWFQGQVVEGGAFLKLLTLCNGPMALDRFAMHHLGE